MTVWQNSIGICQKKKLLFLQKINIFVKIININKLHINKMLTYILQILIFLNQELNKKQKS